MRYDIDSINRRKQRAKVLKIILGIILIILVYNIILVGISMIDGNKFNLFGYSAYIITSDSMTPEINKGDVVITRKIGEDEIEVNDIITFYEEGQNITHRVMEITDVDGYKEYKTKGDNNQVEDSKTVNFDNINGKVILKIPFLGSIISFMKNQIILLIIVLIILIVCLYKIEKNDKSEMRRREKEIKGKKE